MRELHVEVPTPTGTMPVFVAAPQDVDVAPGVLIYSDVFGPREEIRNIARRFASCGYVAALPNLFHRLGSPVFEAANREHEPVAEDAMKANSATTLAMSSSDAGSIIAFSDAGKLGLLVPLWGVIGYCMGGRHAVATAVGHPDRVRAAVSVHGGRMVDETEQSPSHVITRTRVPIHLLFAKDDPTCPAEHQRLLEEVAGKTHGLVTTERVDALHGWSFPERWCFDRRASERVWEKTLSMFDSTLWTPRTPRKA